MPINGIFVLAELGGEAGRLIAEIQREFDPKLARRFGVPHVTLAGSSGVGPVYPDTPIVELRRVLEPIAAATPALQLPFGAPVRFMQREIVVLPLDPHGPIRALHEAIARSGLRFERARFAFTPHATLSLYPTLSPDVLRRLLALRVPAPAEIGSITVYHTAEPQPAKELLRLRLGPGGG